MCNEYRNRKSVRRLIDQCDELNMPLRYRERDTQHRPVGQNIRITDRAPILRNGEDGVALEMMRWSWPGAERRTGLQLPFGEPPLRHGAALPHPGRRVLRVHRGQRREDEAQRQVAVHSRSTATSSRSPACGARKRRTAQDAWAMLTCEPGPDIAPYHDRQVVVLDPARWSAWLAGANEAELLIPSPAGSIAVERVTEQA